MKKLKNIAILGSGKIGCDLLVKCISEDTLKVICMAGRHSTSKGLEFASKLGVPITDRSIEGIFESRERVDIVIDCTSAAHHKHNYEICKNNGVVIIDMTPANLGVTCCPAVNLSECLNAGNINMISCGGQASMPICLALKEENPSLEYIEIISTISSASAGPGTRKNISQYVSSTQAAISNMIAIKRAKVIINITPAIPPVFMKTSILVETSEIANASKTKAKIEEIVQKISSYIPGYKLTIGFESIGEKSICQVMVVGSGHYLPPYAGNLDIINCAALEVIRNL